MKKFIAKNYGRLLGLAATALVAIAPAAQAVVIPVSPVGQWDCIINGAGNTGIIFLNFTEDIDPNSGFPTFEGLFIVAGHTGKNNNSGDPRSGSGGGRGS